MTHLELENLASDYLESQLAEVQRLQVEAHLRDCAGCRELMADLRRVMELCRSAEELEPAPWLVPKILRATVGERKPSVRERWAAFFRPTAQPRLAYAVAMAIFSFSIIINAAGLDLRKVTLSDLNPRTWFYQANRTGHLLYARAEKFYYDLRVVYEIESRFRQLRSQPSEPQPEAPRQEPAPGGSTDRGAPTPAQLASVGGLVTVAASSLTVATTMASPRRTSR
jgi:hypothetical protein